jgi:DNA-3-methyladenine glycosylase II
MNKDFIEGVNYLKKNDMTLKKIINKTDQIKFEIKQNKFESLFRIIISQQLSNKASNTIIKRVENKIEKFIPEKFISLKKDEIRKCGVSNAKYNCIKLISNEIIYNDLDLDSLKSKSEDYTFNKLNSLKGVGPWSINMFLIFGLGKLNVFPIKDVGIQNSIMKFYSIKDKPSFEKMIELKNKWDPFCTIACLYLWNSYDKNLNIE